jgi:hypothetical protein
VTGRRADVLRAAWTAAEVAMRLVRVGNKNWQVTEAVSKVAAAWDCKPVEGAFSFVSPSWDGIVDNPRTGMLSCQQTQNVIDGKKRIILNPGEGQKKDFETITFAEGEVYGIDILISSGEDGKVRPTLYCSEDCAVFLHHDERGTGAVGRNANNDLSKRTHSIVPAQDEDLACGILRSAEKSGPIPVQRTCA